jgi:hypothetical protein
MTEDEAWQELERKQLNKNKTENKIKNIDILFSHWYDSLEGTKSQGFAYKAWCAGWDALQKESTLQEISDIGQWGTSDMAHRSGGLSVEQTPYDLLRQSEREGWRYAKECEAEIKRLKEKLAKYED